MSRGILVVTVVTALASVDAPRFELDGLRAQAIGGMPLDGSGKVAGDPRAK